MNCIRCGNEATHIHNGKPYCEQCRGCYDQQQPENTSAPDADEQSN